MMNTKNKKKDVKRTKTTKEIKNILYKNKNIGFSIDIPEYWMEVKKSSYEDLGINSNTLFIFVINKFTALSAVFSGFAETKTFNKIFDENDFTDQYKVLYRHEEEKNKLKVKQIVVEENNKKIMHNFCLINGMIINFTINIDVKNKIFDQKNIINDPNVKEINELLNTIKVFEPINPPIFIADHKENLAKEECQTIVKVETNIEKNLAQTLIEKECKYKNILVPDLYLKYIFEKEDSSVSLNIINNEMYLKKLNGSFKFIKINEDVANEIERILYNGMPYLESISAKEKSNTKSFLLVKTEQKHAFIDLNNDSNNLFDLKDIFIKILQEIKGHVLPDLDIEELLFSKKVIPVYNEFKEESIEEEFENILGFVKEYSDEGLVKEEKIDELENDTDQEIIETNEDEINQETAEEFENVLGFVKEYSDEGLVKEEKIDELENDADQEIIETNEDEINQESAEEFETVLDFVKEYSEDSADENSINELMDTDVTSSKEVIDKEDVVYDMNQNLNKELEANIVPIAIPILNSTLELEENNPDKKIINYNLNDFQEFFHNIDGHASFKFLFPSEIGEKVIRDFNVFDIVSNEQLMYRIFLFKCETQEKYEEKLNTWMEKNIASSQTTLQNTYNTISNNGIEIKTYILENGKFYKTAYVFGYLIAISGYNEEEILAYADVALENVEIGEDSRAFVEAYDRKMRSINILKAQGIPYIDELPVIKSSYEIKGKTIDEIAKRAIVLCICCNFASELLSNKKKRYIKESKKFFNKLLDNYNVKDVMTKDERLLFDKMDKKLAVQISWQFEGFAILLWTLGLIEEVPFPNTLVEPDLATAMVSSCERYREFLEKCQLRTTDEVLDLADLTYRYNWYCVESKINEEEAIMNPEIVMERHRALNWLLSDEKWDKVEINT